MSDLKERIDELASLLDEFRLAEAERSGEGWKVGFRKRPASPPPPSLPPDLEAHVADGVYADPVLEPVPVQPPVSKGTPVNSPMTGIFYTAPTPTAPPFVRVNEVVEAGQVVGLIEAMKVFNEIVAPMSGTVTEVIAKSGQLVQPGEPLLYIS